MEQNKYLHLSISHALLYRVKWIHLNQLHDNYRLKRESSETSLKAFRASGRTAVTQY